MEGVERAPHFRIVGVVDVGREVHYPAGG